MKSFCRIFDVIIVKKEFRLDAFNDSEFAGSRVSRIEYGEARYARAVP